jgi:hypothetical protein
MGRISCLDAIGARHFDLLVEDTYEANQVEEAVKRAKRLRKERTLKVKQGRPKRRSYGEDTERVAELLDNYANSGQRG